MSKRLYYLSRYLILLPIFIYMISSLNPDPDSYFLIATGREILKQGHVPKINPFTAEQMPIIIQQWLVSIMNALIYDNFGKIGMIVYSVFIMILILTLSVCFLKMFNKTKTAETFTVLFVLSSLLVYLNTRPNSITINLFLILFMVLEKYNRTGRNRYLFFIVLLSLLEINIHAAIWPILFPFIGIYVIPEKIFNVTKKQIKLFITMIISFFVGFLNPNGINGMFYLLKSAGCLGSVTINELKHPEIFGYPGILVIISIVIFVFYLQKEKNIHIILLSLAGIICSALYVRNMYMATICLIPAIGKVITKKEKEKKNKDYNILIVCYMVIAVVIFMILPVNTNIKDYQHSAIAAFDYLDTKENVNLFTGFNSGSYAEFRGYDVYIDSRPEIFSKKITGNVDRIEEYGKVYSGDIDFDEFTNKHQFTHILVTCEKYFDIYLKYNDNYKAVVTGKDYTLYERK